MNLTIDLTPFSEWSGISDGRLYLIAGPCSVESESQMDNIASGLAEYQISCLRGGIWKPRTRPNSFQGVGPVGFTWLKAAGKKLGVPTIVEVAHTEHVEACLKAGIDMVWIGSRTATNPFSVQAIAESLRGVDIVVMVKNPINPDLELWIGAFERLAREGITKVAAIHRGFSSLGKGTYRNTPSWRIPLELRHHIPGLPLFCDPSHICGSKSLIPAIAQEALDLLYDGLMIEVHHDPIHALSDIGQQLKPSEYGTLLTSLKRKSQSTTNQQFQKEMHHLRSQIDKIDGQIIELLSQRMEVCRKIGGCKKQNNITPFQPQRWSEIVESRTQLGQEKDLSEDFVHRIYQLIHEESIRHQEPDSTL